jgi:formamidopyrimidine-DNA glycosylase
MPELPEVETVMRGLRARLEGRVIVGATLHRPDLRWALPEGLATHITGSRIISFRRRGKYILMRVAGGTSVLLHLGMSGRILLGTTSVAPPRLHEHVVLETDDGTRLSFLDPRRFGAIDLVPTANEDEHRLLKALGPEPLSDDFSPAVLSALLAGKQCSIKAALLDQKVVAGLGNIYACEALFRAELSPRRLAYTVARSRAERLVVAVRATLIEAIEAGGSSLRDYVRPDGELGYFQHVWKVYDREGQPCERCPGPPLCGGIRRIAQNGRSTFHCPRTQR